MQKYKEINGNDYVKNSRTTINETMQSIQSMNSGTAFPTNNLFEGMKCYRTDLKKTYTLTDVENNTWVEDAHATLSDEATHAASATKLQTARSLNLGGAVTADASTFDGTANATINVKTLDATKLKGTASVSTTGNAATATKVVTTAAAGTSANIAEATMASSDSARIRVSGAENAGELALETADDGNEAIVARQYTGTYTTPVRTAKILDESGNTSFPGTVVAPKFTGSLNGNAATATKLQTPRTLSLSGKAAGSTTFDGSSNAIINVTSVNADTASKLSTARKINITGNASGSASFDGTSDINISTTVNESKHAVNADSASKLSTARKINITGNASGSANFDGSGNVSISTTVNESKHAAAADNSDKLGGYPLKPTSIGGSYGTVPLVNTDGVMEVGKYIDWHATNGGTEDYSSRWEANNDGTVSVGTINGTLKGNADSATTATNANKLALESGSNYLDINTTTDSWSVLGSNPGSWLKSIRTEASAPPYSLGNYSAGIAFGGVDTKGVITHAYNSPAVKFAGGTGSTAGWKFTIYGGYNNETYDLNNFPTKTGGGASGTWGINISGNAASATTANALNGIINREPATNNHAIIPGANSRDYCEFHEFGAVWNFIKTSNEGSTTVASIRSDGFHGNVVGNADTATNADTVDGYHASDIINRISAANTGGIVAASLTENGYVKFANGLILQWGNMSVGSGRTEAFSYPVTMSKVLFATTNPISGSNGRINNRVESPSSSECQVYNGSGDTSNMLILLLGLA